MWQLYAFGAILTAAGENVIDKAAIVQNVAIDFFIASFWRPFMFFVAISVIGLLGFIGPLHFFFHWSILLIAPFGVGTALFYTYLLQKVELTSINAAAYLVPILFLLIDTRIAHVGLTGIEIAGILLLVLGGIGFAVDATTLRFKEELDWRIWAVFAFNIAWGGTEAYLFKYLNGAYGVNGVSFFATLWLVCSALLLALVVLKGRLGLLFSRASRVYVAQSTLSKSCDALNSVLWAQAITLAAVSQVSAFESLYPLVLFGSIVFVQVILRIPLKEKFSSAHLGWKAFATVLLVVGGFLVG